MATHHQGKYSTPEPGEATGQVYTQPYMPEAQLQTLQRIAQALERMAERLNDWHEDYPNRAIKVKVTNLRNF